MAKEIAFENCLISNFEGLVTVTLDRVVLHTIVHHSSTSTYTPNFTEIKETFLWADGCTYLVTYLQRHLPTYLQSRDPHGTRGNMYRQSDEIWIVVFAICEQIDRQTQAGRHTHMLIAILRTRTVGKVMPRGNKCLQRDRPSAAAVHRVAAAALHLVVSD